MCHELKHGGSQTLVDEVARQSSLRENKKKTKHGGLGLKVTQSQTTLNASKRHTNHTIKLPLTLRSVLRTQIKVQTDGLLLDLRTTNPPGPFSPLGESKGMI